MRVLVEAYGCSLNRGEAHEFKEMLVERGHDPVSEEGEAEAVAIFTCGVIDTTERHMLKRIGQLAEEKAKIMVCGCLGDIAPEKVKEVAPGALLFHPSEHEKALDTLGVGEHSDLGLYIPDNSAVGILPIASGCNGECAYCVTRLARGKLNSRRPETVMENARRLIASGVVEIQICAQDTAAYGDDLDLNLEMLISDLAGLEGNFMMRIGMMNPKNALKHLDDIMTAYESDKVFKFLHLPVQSGSDGVLERMKRDYDLDNFHTVLDAFRERFPGGAVSTDIIAGFPGETEEEFEGSVRLVKLIEPDIVNITRFSARPGTAAENMDDQIPSRIAKDRSRILTELRFELSEKKYGSMVGKNVRALATERKRPGTTFLRTRNYRPVVIEGEVALSKWHEVKITGLTRTHLIGKRKAPLEPIFDI